MAESVASNPPKDDSDKAPALALMILLSPDGYYTYLGIEKPKEDSETKTGSTVIDEELVKKNYRRLSLKHHPDRPTGDAETFRVLNRAQRVLMHSKLRQQYDLLGLDLDDDEDEHSAEEDGTKEDGDEAGGPTNPESIVSHMASATLAAIFQVMIRTVMMGAVSVFVCRYRITVFPAVAFLAFIAYRVHSAVQTTPGGSFKDMMSPFMIAIGLLLMHQGRSLPEVTWSFTFWFGEALVMNMFTYNSLPPQKSHSILVGIFILSLILALCLGGSLWRYIVLVGLEVFLAIVAAIAFPMMEMILEESLKDKLRKVGDKIRAHNQRMEAYYSKNKQ